MALAPELRQNTLLAALPDSELERWRPHLESLSMPLGKVLYEPGGRLSYVYFPTTSIVSLLYVMEDGASAEKASSASRCSWAANRRRAGRWCRAPAWGSG